VLVLLLTKSWDYGMLQFLINGEPVGKAVDLVAETVAPHETTLPPVALSAGEHVLTVRNVGSSADGGGCYFGIDGWLQHRHE